jgi:pilus assembly protein CpaF
MTAARDLAAGTPSWLAHALGDAACTDLCLNGTGAAYADRGAGLRLIEGSDRAEPTWRDDDLRQWVLALLSSAGKTWDAKMPFVDASLPSGFRLHVAFPPMSAQGLLVSLRRLSRSDGECRLDERWGGSPGIELLKQAVRAGDSILISGSTGSGKTTLAGDLLGLVPRTERVLALEDTPELGPSHPHFISLVSRPPNADGFGEVTLRTLLKQALRMRPDRIVLGECRGPEVLELLQCLNTGHRGSLATLHANSPRDALRRVELLCLLAAGGSVPASSIRELLALGIRWVAQVARVGSERRITDISRLEGREGDTILLRPMVQGGTHVIGGRATTDLVSQTG